MQPTLRPASPRDLERINDIYNHFVIHSTCTYQEEPETMQARRAWFDRHGTSHPVIVAEDGGEVVGWGSLSPFHQRSAYRFAVENSVYVDHAWHRRGIGSLLLADLVERARALELHTIVAGIDAEQHGSIALHRKHGFATTAHLTEVGFKFGRWLDVIYMQRML